MNDNHLTVEQMELLLSNPESPETPQHLRDCATCSAEFESLLAAMVDLRLALIASSQQHRRRAVMPAQTYRTPRALGSLVAATALLCIAGPIALHHKPSHRAVAPPPPPLVQVTVSDEQLMSDIQQDLSSSVSQRMLPLTAKDTSAETTTATSSSKENE
jgi:hypothetical protein